MAQNGRQASRLLFMYYISKLGWEKHVDIILERSLTENKTGPGMCERGTQGCVGSVCVGGT